jgi:hypothetical protein
MYNPAVRPLGPSQPQGFSNWLDPNTGSNIAFGGQTAFSSTQTAQAAWTQTKAPMFGWGLNKPLIGGSSGTNPKGGKILLAAAAAFILFKFV